MNAPLTTIPDDFGVAGAFLDGSGSQGKPSLRDILVEHTAAIGVLQGGSTTVIAARFATTANLNLATTGLTAIDGVTPVAGDVVLVKDQSTGAQNGLYLASAAAWARLTNPDGTTVIKPGLAVEVAEGTANADTLWELTTDAPITVGTTSIAFSKQQLNAATLASTAHSNGAALIGVEDAGNVITATTVEGALIEPLDGRRVATLADDSVIGGVELIHMIAILDGATADKDVILTHKSRIVGVSVIKGPNAGGASDTLQLKNGATAITDAMSINVAGKTRVSAATIDDAQTVINAGGTLRVTKTKASVADVACRVYVHVVRVP